MKLTNVEGVVCTASSLCLPERSVDFAFICDTYHHFEYPYKVMRSLWCALRPGGRVVLIDFLRQEGKSPKWVLNHVRAAKEEVKREVELAGFTCTGEEQIRGLINSYFLTFRKQPRRTASGHTADTLNDMKLLMKAALAVLVDVRERAEWDAGHLADAKLVPLSRLKELAHMPEAAKQLEQLLPKEKIIYLHCRSGRRVLVASPILERFGYDVRPLPIGYTDLLKAGFRPVVAKKPAAKQAPAKKTEPKRKAA